MINRQLKEFGIEPLIAYFLGIFLFVILSFQLFEKTEYGVYIYTFLAITCLLKLVDSDRNQFLMNVFSVKMFKRIRIIENLIIAFPFFLYLIYKNEIKASIVIVFCAFFLSIFKNAVNTNFIIPTPFYKYPFEFIIGFRGNFYIYFIAYFICYLSIDVGNFNLGIFSLMLVFVGCMSFFSLVEDKFYVWIFSLQPKDFLKYKMRIIVQYPILLCLPIVTALSICFYSNLDIIIGMMIVGIVFVVTTMLGKYSIYPDKLNVRFAVLIGISVWLPMLLVIIIPYLYFESSKKLKEILC